MKNNRKYFVKKLAKICKRQKNHECKKNKKQLHFQIQKRVKTKKQCLQNPTLEGKKNFF